MKQFTIIRAYKALKKLGEQELPIKTACKVHRLMVSLRPVWEFQVQEEEKIISRLQPGMNGGDLQFKTPEEAQEFRDRLRELNEMEVDDLAFTPVSVPVPEDALLTANDIDALDGFISFVEE